MEKLIDTVKENMKVCAIDLDDVLADSTKFWLEFLSQHLHEKFDDLHVAKNTVPYQVYKDLKLQYRQSGVKIDIPIIEYADSMTNHLKQLGYLIVIMTARPIEEFPVLYSITEKWLIKNNIAYDSIIFSKSKHIKTMTLYPNLKFFVEDHRAIANRLSKFGYRVFLLNNRYNKGRVEKTVVRVNKLDEIFSYIGDKDEE